MNANVVKKPRVPQAERSARMRKRLSKAAFNVINKVGYSNFRTSAVSKEAGVSQGAQLHHFPTKDSLALTAMEYAYAQASKQFEQNFAQEVAPEALLKLILKDFKDFYLSDYFMVALNILMAGGQDVLLRQQLNDMALKNRLHVEHSWLERMLENGWVLNDAKDFLSLSHSIVRGFSTRSLVDNNEAEFDRLLERWQQLVATVTSKPA